MRRHRRQALVACRSLQAHRFLDVVLEENGAFRFGQMRGVFEAISTVMSDVRMSDDEDFQFRRCHC